MIKARGDSMIYITGDTHGEYDAFLNRIYQYPVSKDDIVIVCGDFGFVWDTPYHRYFLAKLTAEPFTIAFVDGNHEDFDLLYTCLLYTSPSPRDPKTSRMPSSA